MRLSRTAAKEGAASEEVPGTGAENAPPAEEREVSNGRQG